MSAPRLTATAPRRSWRRLSPHVAAIALTAVLMVYLAASSAPSPLYVVYQEEWGFGSITLTIVFAVYVLGMLASLLVIGGLSDYVGRKPVLVAAVALESVALVLFLVAGDVATLTVARIAQGIATGAAITTLAATLVDLDPPHAPGRAGLINAVAPLAGLAVGAVGSGALVQFAPAPTRLVYALLLAAMVLAAIVVARMPETGIRRHGALASLRPRLAVPEHVRADVYVIVPMLAASWAVGGIYLSLGPSVAVGLFDLESHLIGGLVVTLLAGTGATAALILRRWQVERVLMLAGTLLPVGMLLTLGGIELHAAALAAVGTVVSGTGFGASAVGCFAALAKVAPPDQRGEIFAVAFVVSYLAFSIPAVAAGFAASEFGLRSTTEVYGLGVVVLSGVAVTGQRMLAVERREAARKAAVGHRA